MTRKRLHVHSMGFYFSALGSPLVASFLILEHPQSVNVKTLKGPMSGREILPENPGQRKNDLFKFNYLRIQDPPLFGSAANRKAAPEHAEESMFAEVFVNGFIDVG